MRYVVLRSKDGSLVPEVGHRPSWVLENLDDARYVVSLKNKLFGIPEDDYVILRMEDAPVELFDLTDLFVE